MKILKWILGLLAGLAGIFAMFGGQSKAEIKKKIKENDKSIKKKTKEIKNLKTGNEATKQTIRNKQKTLDEMKKVKQKGHKKRDVGADEAAEFLKNYVKKKNK